MKKSIKGSLLISAVTASVFGLAQATVQYIVTLEGGGQGTARLTQTKRPEGGKVVRLVATLRRGNATVEIRTESTFDKDGSPLRKVQSYGPSGRAPQHETIVTFDAEGANAVVRERGVPKVSKVPLVPKLNRANAAETWFLTVKPKVGEIAKAWTFDPDALEWVPTETTYVGLVKEGNLLRILTRERKTETVVDDHGLPIRLQDGAMTLERRLP